MIGALLVMLVVVTAARPTHTTLSLFELRRRQELKDRKASETLHREELLAQLSTLTAPLKALLLVAIALLFVYVLGWNKGTAAALAAGLLYERVARLKLVRKMSSALYVRYEGKLLGIADKYEGILRLAGGKTPLKEKRLVLESPEELAHIVESSHIFSDEDRQLLKNALRFKRQLVKDIMTPWDVVVTVKYTELLGPLVLDDLHKTGHTIFPVVNAHDIIGLLDSGDHVALRSKESVHVRDVMHTDVARVNQAATLDEALRALIAAKQQLLIVMDDDEKTVGLLSLGDVIQTLTGWKRR